MYSYRPGSLELRRTTSRAWRSATYPILPRRTRGDARTARLHPHANSLRTRRTTRRTAPSAARLNGAITHLTTTRVGNIRWFSPNHSRLSLVVRCRHTLHLANPLGRTVSQTTCATGGRYGSIVSLGSVLYKAGKLGWPPITSRIRRNASFPTDLRRMTGASRTARHRPCASSSSPRHTMWKAVPSVVQSNGARIRLEVTRVGNIP
mmetsp:Transcript_16984/g.33832  ORF Transcript_16984/g.33832 Transcript_16984/m.33832 type:complete len:206 (+) Transcript_16984:248-865(+)